MGWTYEHRDKSRPIIDILSENLGEGYEVVESSVRIDRAWLAIKHPQGYVFACEVLIHHARSDYYDFGTKWIDESMGPVHYDCPKRVFDALTDADLGEYARMWREKQQAEYDRRAALPKVKTGDRVRFSRPITFADGTKLQELEFEGRNNFRGPYGTRYRLERDWRAKRTYALV